MSTCMNTRCFLESVVFYYFRWNSNSTGDLNVHLGDSNESAIKAISLDYQNNTFIRASHFSVHSFAAPHDYDMNLSIFTLFYGGRKQATTKIFFLFLNLDQAQESSPIFDKVTGFQ